MHHFLNVHFVVVFAVPVTNNVEYCIYVHLSTTVSILYYTGRFQKAFQSVSSQLVDTAYFMSDVQNWQYLVVAPKRRDYGKGARKGRKHDKLWNLFKSNSLCTYLPTYILMHVYVHLYGVESMWHCSLYTVFICIEVRRLFSINEF